MSQSSGSFCAAAHCSEKKQVSRNLHFFRFPKDSERYVLTQYGIMIIIMYYHQIITRIVVFIYLLMN